MRWLVSFLLFATPAAFVTAATPSTQGTIAFTSDDAGNGFMTAENDQSAGPDAVSIVVHPVEFIDNAVPSGQGGHPAGAAPRR